ncbi:MAG: alpha/beta hydrolase-fold protein [Candidatus Eisenbacteria bacterium]
MKLTDRWYSDRLKQEVGIARWGHFGTPVLIFPTAGGDCEEIERFHVIDAVSDLIDAGRINVYSCDSVAGRAWVQGEGSDRHRSWVQNQFHQFVYHELVPGIRNDCNSPEIGIIAAGASIGAFNAMAVLCRFPDAFTKALCLSGTYDLTRFLNGTMPDDFYFSSPLHFLPGLEGGALDAARERFVLFASGQGRAEDIGQSWRAAGVLGEKGIPNRVDAWGAEWHHDWPTWRRMLPQYLGELA